MALWKWLHDCIISRFLQNGWMRCFNSTVRKLIPSESCTRLQTKHLLLFSRIVWTLWSPEITRWTFLPASQYILQWALMVSLVSKRAKAPLSYREMFDLSGKKVLNLVPSFNGSEWVFNYQGNAGAYLVRVLTNNGIFTRKILKRN